jgi:hypothetical protein
LLTGYFESTTETIGGTSYTYNLKAIKTLTLANDPTGAANDQIVTFAGQVEELEFEVTSGALLPVVNPLENPNLDNALVQDGRLVLSAYSYIEPTNSSVDAEPLPTKDVASLTPGTDFPDPITNNDGVQFKDTLLMKVELQTPDPATIAFVAPVFFGFVGYAVRRRRRS